MKVVKSLIFILFALCSLSGKAQEVAADSTGYIVRVPLFVNEGDVLRIDTRSGEYLERAK